MRAAYLDTSCLVAVAFDEPGATELAEAIASFDELFASNLLEAELRAALVREEVEYDRDALAAGITWVLPDRPLSPEIERVLAAGYARGADLWHLAAALYLAEAPGDLSFLSLDRRQADLAAELGFVTPLG